MIAEFGGEEFLLRVAIRPSFGEDKKMDPWRDYPKFTDGALMLSSRGFPSHPDRAAAVAEFERRRKERDRQVEARSDQVEKDFRSGKESSM